MTAQPPVLIVVDDDEGILEVVGRLARRTGFEVVACNGGLQALAQLGTKHADIALVDLRMPDLGGLDVVRAIGDLDPRCQTVLMTGYASVETAVEAIKTGATDYLSKPLDLARLEQLLTDIRDDIERRRSVMTIEGDLARRLEFCGMIGRGPAMQELFGVIRRLAPHVRTALVTGETGTGKELAARAFHTIGPRRDRRFITVNCSAVIEALFESELFGHVRGALTGATENKPGLFEMADGGTLFLDEIGELPLVDAGQAPARARDRRDQAGRIARDPPRQRAGAGGDEPRSASGGGGRKIPKRSVLSIERRRSEDCRRFVSGARTFPYLTAAFVRETSERLQKPVAGLTPAAERLLAAGYWEGNIRELRNVIERACILVDSELISERELAVNMPSAPAYPAAEHWGESRGCRREGSPGDGRARPHSARAGAGGRQQEGRGQDARPEPTRALSSIGASRFLGNHHPPS